MKSQLFNPSPGLSPYSFMTRARTTSISTGNGGDTSTKSTALPGALGGFVTMREVSRSLIQPVCFLSPITQAQMPPFQPSEVWALCLDSLWPWHCLCIYFPLISEPLGLGVTRTLWTCSFTPFVWSQWAHLKFPDPLLWNLNISLAVIPPDPLLSYHFSGSLISNLAPQSFASFCSALSYDFTAQVLRTYCTHHWTCPGLPESNNNCIQGIYITSREKENKHISDKLSG